MYVHHYAIDIQIMHFLFISFAKFNFMLNYHFILINFQYYYFC